MHQQTSETPYQDLARATGRQATELSRRPVGVDLSTGTRLGELYFFRDHAGLDLEWAVVELRPEDHRLLVVPLDSFPFVGSRDVELPESSLGSVAHARCDVGAWLEPATLRSERRTGRLPAEDLKRIRRRRQAVLEGRLEPSLLEDDADADPEYQLWREGTLQRVAAELEAMPSKGKLLQFPRVARWALPLAAAACLVLAVWLAVTMAEMARLEETLASERQRIEEMATSRSELEDALSRLESEARQDRESAMKTLEELRADLTRKLSERETRIGELLRVFREAPQLLPHFELRGWDRERTGRGDAIPLPVGDDARLFVLSLEVEDPEPYLRYRLQVALKGTDDVVWQDDRLVKQGRWLSLVLPTGLFESGTQYDLRLAGLEGNEAIPLGEKYLVRIER